MQELTALNLADVDEPTTREAVRLACVTRRITRSLLQALGFSAGEQWEHLRRLPFIDTWRDGLRIHDAVREALARTLRASDPESYLECRRKAWSQLRGELRSATHSELWRYTADMLYLIENPVVREAFFSSGHQELAVEQANDTDIEVIRAITRRHEGPAAASILDDWWRCLPQSFHVVRNRNGSVVAFYCMCEARELTSEIKVKDPIAAAWSRHLGTLPGQDSVRTLFLRRWLSEKSGEAPSSEQAACWLDIKRTYMELRPDLRQVYLTVVDLATYAPVATQLGFSPIAEAAIELDGNAYQTAMLDFGPASVDGWITALVGAELGVEENSILDRDRQALILDGERIGLTPLEFKLVEYLEERKGATASRDEILEHVWGNASLDSSSNVVDAVVKSLRRKLGAEAHRIETVRGFGYRWVAD
ncbi:MAG: winged helix-turn-helix domain-containing protein [Acidobacteriota bacterium]